MNMKQCPRGHYYDGDLNATCPTCAAEGSMGFGETEAVGGFETQPVTGAFGGGFVGGFDPIGATEPIGQMNRGPVGGDDQFTGTKPPTQSFSDATMNLFENKTPGVDNYSDETMAVNPGSIAGFTPVVGWLVCIDGPDKGHDYRIRAGYNYIGRAEYMDICVRGDKQISREKHAVIAYDDLEKLFFFGPADGRNIVRVNGKTAMAAKELSAYDVLTIGTSQFIFIPLCGERFDWNK